MSKNFKLKELFMNCVEEKTISTRRREGPLCSLTVENRAWDYVGEGLIYRWLRFYTALIIEVASSIEYDAHFPTIVVSVGINKVWSSLPFLLRGSHEMERYHRRQLSTLSLRQWWLRAQNHYCCPLTQHTLLLP